MPTKRDLTIQRQLALQARKQATLKFRPRADEATGALIKLCSDCLHSLPIDKFTKRVRSIDGVCPYCRACQQKRVRASRLRRRLCRLTKTVRRIEAELGALEGRVQKIVVARQAPVVVPVDELLPSGINIKKKRGKQWKIGETAARTTQQR